MLFPWNSVFLHKFKRINLLLFLWDNNMLCSCSCILFAYARDEHHLAWFSLMLWFPLILWQDEPAEYLQKASLNSTELAFRFYSSFLFPVLLCKYFTGEPLDTCPVSLGAGRRDSRAVHKQKVMGLLVIQRGSGGSGMQLHSKANKQIQAQWFLLCFISQMRTCKAHNCPLVYLYWWDATVLIWEHGLAGPKT